MSDSSTLTGDGVQAAANLGRQAEQAKAVNFAEVDAGLVVRVVHQNERIQVVDTECTLEAPLAPRGEAVLYEPDAFSRYLERNLTESTTVWAHPDQSTVTALFDDHHPNHGPRWREHVASLVLKRDPEWQAWLSASGHLNAQEVFAEFVEDHLMSIVDPDPATMLEVASTFQARRNVSFERGTRLQSGDVQLRYVDDTTATAGRTGTMEIPERFTVRVAPYLGVGPVDLVARLRYRVRDGDLRIGFALHRPDIHQREAFDNVVAHIDANTDAPVFIGECPQTLRDRRGAVSR